MTPFLNISEAKKLWQASSVDGVVNAWWESNGTSNDAERAYKRLWMCVLLCSIKDLKPHRTPIGTIKIPPRALRSGEWINSHDTQPGSFLWICVALGLDAADVRHTIISLVVMLRNGEIQ